MAPERKKLFGCPSCGFRVTGLEETCPRCNAKFGQEALFECPFCGDTVNPRGRECPVCHISYEEFVSKAEERVADDCVDRLLTEIIEIESKRVKEEAKKLSCPKCSWMVDRTEDICPRCGAVFSESVTYQCPVCASLVSADASECNECHAVFIEDESAQEGAAAETAVEAEPEPTLAPVPTSEVPAAQTTPEPEPAEEPVSETAKIEPATAAEPEPSVSDEPPQVKDEPGDGRAAAAAPARKKVRRRKLKPKAP